jgi:hypothetical protein
MKKTFFVAGAILALVLSSAFLGDTSLALSDMSERERFILANAEITCYVMTTMRQRTMSVEGDPMEDIATKHGLTLDEIQSLTSKYPDTANEVVMASQKQCPEEWEGFNQLHESSPDAWKQDQQGDQQNLDHWKKQ